MINREQRRSHRHCPGRCPRTADNNEHQRHNHRRHHNHCHNQQCEYICVRNHSECDRKAGKGVENRSSAVFSFPKIDIH